MYLPLVVVVLWSYEAVTFINGGPTRLMNRTMDRRVGLLGAQFGKLACADPNYIIMPEMFVVLVFTLQGQTNSFD